LRNRENGKKKRRGTIPKREQYQIYKKDMSATPIKIIVRVRPILPSKGEELQGINEYVKVKSSEQQLTIGFGPRAKTHTYTSTMGSSTTQEDFFKYVGLPALDNIWEGKNATLLAYGPKGSGKRFTTFGTKKDEGLIPRLSKQLFERLEAANNSSYKVEFSFFELYCEECNDLLIPSGRNLPVSYIEDVGYHANGLTRCPVMDHDTLDKLLEASLTARAVSAVSTNTDTIQAHTFYQLILTRTAVDQTTMKAVETTASLLIGDLGDAGGGEEERAALSSVNDSPGDSHGKHTYMHLLASKINYIMSYHNHSFLFFIFIFIFHATASLRGVLKHLLSRNSKKGQERDDAFNRSSLTKVLRNSLCENSSTSIIVALPPTDIDQDATKFTLAVANKFKQIRTYSSNNVDVHQKNLDSISKAINALKTKLAAVSSADSSYEGIQQEINTANDLLNLHNTNWDDRIKTINTVQKSLNVFKMIEIEKNKKTTPYLSNISNDPMVDGRVINFLLPGKTQVGAAHGPSLKSMIYGMHTSALDNSMSIALMGHSVDQTHCAITNDNNNLTLMNMSQHTCVGGDVLHPSDQHPLKDGDWVLFGKTFDRQVYEIVVSYCLMQRLLFNNFYLTIFIQTLSSCSPFSPPRYSTIKTVNQIPSIRGAKNVKRPIWDTVVESMCQRQLSGLQRQQNLARMNLPSSIHLQNRVLHIIPHIDEANFLAKELARPKKFDINIIASGGGHRSMGRRLSVGAADGETKSNNGTELQIEVIVQEPNSKTQPSIWDEYKFLERSFGMRQMHMQFVTTMGGNIDLLNKKYPAGKDSFYDPLQDVLVGTAVAYLNPLSYIIAIDQPLTILDQRGSAEGELLINIKPIVYRNDGSLDNVVDTDEENEPRLENFIGSTMQIHLSIKGCRHIEMSKSDGVYVMYRWLNEEMDTSTNPSLDSKTENPTLDFTRMYDFDVSLYKRFLILCFVLFYLLN
jgi:hypothetical protein